MQRDILINNLQLYLFSRYFQLPVQTVDFCQLCNASFEEILVNTKSKILRNYIYHQWMWVNYLKKIIDLLLKNLVINWDLLGQFTNFDPIIILRSFLWSDLNKYTST